MKGKSRFLFTLLLVAFSVFSLVGCGKKTNAPSTAKKEPPTIISAPETYDLGVGGDLVVNVDLKSKALVNVKDNEQIVDGTNYLRSICCLSTTWETYVCDYD